MILAPVVGGLVIGLMARYGSEKIRGHGMPEAIESILLGGSKVAAAGGGLKPLSSAIAIGTGGPFGAEGPIIMTGGALGSLFAQFLHLTADERKTLLVAGLRPAWRRRSTRRWPRCCWRSSCCCSSGARAASCRSPPPSCVAGIVRGPMLGAGALFPAPAGRFTLTCGLRALRRLRGSPERWRWWRRPWSMPSEGAFRRLPIHWMWWPAIGGLIIGLGGLVVPQALGVGYNVIGAELDGTIALKLIVGMLIVKTLIWSLSLGSGTSGGILAPMLMIGGALGGLEAHIFPRVGAGFWALIGLAGVLGGVMRSPLTGVVFALELHTASKPCCRC